MLFAKEKLEVRKKVPKQVQKILFDIKNSDWILYSPKKKKGILAIHTLYRTTKTLQTSSFDSLPWLESLFVDCIYVAKPWVTYNSLNTCLSQPHTHLNASTRHASCIFLPALSWSGVKAFVGIRGGCGKAVSSYPATTPSPVSILFHIPVGGWWWWWLGWKGSVSSLPAHAAGLGTAFSSLTT